MTAQDRAPAFQFYAKDWLSDPKVRAMSYADRGRYIDLLAYMWEHGSEGCLLPLATARSLFGASFVSRLCAQPAPVLDTFMKDDFEWLFSNRLSNEAQKCSSRSRLAREAATARWKKNDR